MSAGMQVPTGWRIVHRERPASPTGGWFVEVQILNPLGGGRVHRWVTMPAYAERITVDVSVTA